ncbi:RNB domain-containing ribonuclease [Arcobacter sp. F2176]|uniref:RNB domain-containing ribonuclease n=1 Tax=Arcobacter sp. F2176 TaxID=2044511 RepID=UPI00100ABDC7|nr:RNB domain-containing ribonuclease [Arcobacter sp. F2176]RXJ82288.1 ribonuclease R [Arcobacter sp. F2176]
MIQTIFRKVISGSEDFAENEKEYLVPFIKDDIVSYEDGIYKLNSKYRVGIVKIKNKFAFLSDLDNEHKNLKLDIDDLKGAYNNDLILVKRVFNPRSSFKAKVEKVLYTHATSLLVYVNEGEVFSVKEGIKLELKIDFSSFTNGNIYVINSKTFEIEKDVGNIQDPKVDQFISLFLYDELIRLEKHLDVDAKMNDTNERVDLTALPFTTIDPASAKDHDDAIYFDVKENTLYVAIADVSYFVKENSELDKQALQKSTSIYLPNKVLPMLPPSLSEEMCSLKENVDRYSYVFKIYLDKDYEIIKSELFEAIIKSHKKFSYGRIDRVIEGHLDKYSETEKEIFDYLIPLYDITKKIRAKRLQKGYDFISKEYRQKLNHNLELEGISVEESTASHQLIEECMLMANIEASKKLSNVGIFRIHEEPSFQSLSKLVDEVNLLGIKAEVKSSVHETITDIQARAKNSVLIEEINDLIIKSQSQAKYSSKNLGHFGLGFDSYSHFTSPIRRYSDLVLHRMLKTKKAPAIIDDICEHISANERKVDQLVWDYEDRKYARWAKNHIGEEFKAQIVDIERGIAKFYKDMPGLRIHLDNYRGEKLFLKIKITIKSSDLISKNIVGTIKNV